MSLDDESAAARATPRPWTPRVLTGPTQAPRRTGPGPTAGAHPAAWRHPFLTRRLALDQERAAGAGEIEAPAHANLIRFPGRAGTPAEVPVPEGRSIRDLPKGDRVSLLETPEGRTRYARRIVQELCRERSEGSRSGRADTATARGSAGRVAERRRERDDRL